jgi:hypothetical protein
VPSAYDLKLRSRPRISSYANNSPSTGHDDGHAPSFGS